MNYAHDPNGLILHDVEPPMRPAGERPDAAPELGPRLAGKRMAGEQVERSPECLQMPFGRCRSELLDAAGADLLKVEASPFAEPYFPT